MAARATSSRLTKRLRCCVARIKVLHALLTGENLLKAVNIFGRILEVEDALDLAAALAGVGVAPNKIRVVFNRVDTDVADEFAPILGYAKTAKTCIANPDAAIYENEVFNLLSAKKTTIAAVVQDETDYKALLKGLDKDADKKKAAHYADMHAIKGLARGVNRQLDGVFAALFA